MYAILALVSRPRDRFDRAWRIARDNSLLMVAGALVALAWANLAPASYARWTGPWHFAVNDVAMVFFFGVAMKEILEAMAPGGALHSRRQAAVPVIAAVGGMTGPALLYAVQSLAIGRHDLLAGWAIPTATDIAFSYLVARAIFPPTHPALPFLLLLAIADDAIGLIVLATFYPAAPLRVAWLGLVVVACGIAWMLRRAGATSFWPYVLGAGAVSWAGLFAAGVHPTLALVPVLPFLPRASHDPGVAVEPARPPADALNAFERWWTTPVEFVLFCFALVNAGVPFSGAGTATWIVLVSLLAGKPLGIAAAVWLAERVGFRRAGGLEWSAVAVLGITAGVGFTVALFFTTAAFPAGATLDQAKLGALLSVTAGAVALAAARLLPGVGGRHLRPSSPSGSTKRRTSSRS
jgi:NhaA family Na+:H+ antiporter